MKCDLHLHTRHSGMCTVPGLRRICRESYNDPLAVYDTCKRRGMGLVTVTDHDSIDAAEPLRAHSDFFLSEEVTCYTPSGTEIHVGVYGIGERHHVELQRRRNDLPSLIAWMREQRLLFAVNHAFSALTGARTPLDFALFADWFPAFETRNGHIPEPANRSAEAMAVRYGKIRTGGSDSHTLHGIGLTYTEVAGARNAREYLDGLRHGYGRVTGEHGRFSKLTAAVYGIASSLLREKPWTLSLLPLFAAVPLTTLTATLRDIAFARVWENRVLHNWSPADTDVRATGFAQVGA